MTTGIYKRTKETRKKLSEAKIRNPTKFWLGKHRSEETKMKLYTANIGKKLSEEARRRISKAQWKGGKKKDKRGYIKIYQGFGSHKYNFEHRIIMEKFLGRKLERWEEIHHKNGIKNDNRIENLEVVIRKTHFTKIRCPKCLYEFKFT